MYAFRYSDEFALGEVLHQSAGAEDPWRAFSRQTNYVRQPAQRRICNFDLVSQLVGKPTALRVAILRRRKERS